MPNADFVPEIDRRFSAPDAAATTWDDACEEIRAAETYWVTTVRSDGRPHVTPLIGVAFDDAVYFCTGADEQKAKNLARNPYCTLTTGSNRLHEGLDIVVEGQAVRVTEERLLEDVAEEYLAKYGEEWQFAVHGNVFHHDGGVALVFAVRPAKVLAFAKGDYSQTRWRFNGHRR